jgi:hypothetical protein
MPRDHSAIDRGSTANEAGCRSHLRIQSKGRRLAQLNIGLGKNALLLPPEPDYTRHQIWCPASGWPEEMGQSPAGSHARILALPQ